MFVLNAEGGALTIGGSDLTGFEGKKIIVSNPQCGHGTVVSFPASSWLASNSILPLQCWQGQVTNSDFIHSNPTPIRGV